MVYGPIFEIRCDGLIRLWVARDDENEGSVQKGILQLKQSAVLDPLAGSVNDDQCGGKFLCLW